MAAGLSYTAERAKQLGLTRLGRKHLVGGLDPGDAAEAIASWAGHFRVPLDPERRVDGRRPWQELVLRLVHDPFNDLPLPSDGERAFWPAHLHHVLKGVAEEAVAGRSGTVMRHDRIAEAARKRRKAYYGDRASEEMRASRKLLGAVMRDLKPGTEEGNVGASIEGDAGPGKEPKMFIDNVIDSIEQHASANGPAAWQLPERSDGTSMTSRQYLRHLLHRGVLHVDDKGIVSCPIPSFRRHMIAAADLDPAGRTAACSRQG